MRISICASARGQAGQILLFTALLMTVLIGVVGLALDYGYGAMARRQAQNAADAAALGGAYEVGTGATEASALSEAQVLVQKHGFASSELTLSFLDSNGAATSSASQVATVKASLTHQTPTVFLRVLKIASQTESAQAGASVGGSSGGCVVCVLNGTASDALDVEKNDSVSVSGGPIMVDSSASEAALLSKNDSVTTQSLSAVGGVTLDKNGSVSPAPVSGAAAVADPLAKASVPSCPSGNPAGQASVTLEKQSAVTAQPGTYTNLTVDKATQATMSPGVYCIAGGALTISQVTTLTATGVLIYLTCGTYPIGSACQPHQTGAALSVSQVTGATLSGLASGADQGIVIFADRNNIASLSFSKSTGSDMSGTIYARAGSVEFDTFTTSAAVNSMIICDTLSVTQSGPFNVAYTPSQNFSVSGAPALTQ